MNNDRSSFFCKPIFIIGCFFVLLRGAVFQSAGAFNSDLSSWDVGKVTNMAFSTYTLSPPSPRSVLVLAVSFLLLLSVSALILFLNNVLSSSFFQPIFIVGLFFFDVVVSCCSV